MGYVHVVLYPSFKRSFDLTVASGLMAAASPLLAYAAWRIKRADGGPVFYRGVRAGRGGEPFGMLKLRTMVVGADQLGGSSTGDDDTRLTKSGAFLRRWKLDELPQLWNVVRGDMSLVGPRPQVLSDVARYSEEERHLLDVRPGITDWASIRFRHEGNILAGRPDADEAYDQLIRPEKISLGLRYVREANLRTDLKILGETLRAVRS